MFIVEYIYSGKVTLENSRLEDFMRVGDILNIKGLSTSQSTPNKPRYIFSVVLDSSYVPIKETLLKTNKSVKAFII